ncbi:MAG: DUF4339 domain-containing protein [Planctomycetes bacterium]|nr:DUF4339 domain-containing protein [Planctomycetota bacterium]
MQIDIDGITASGSILMAVVCALIAHAKGRSVIVWGLLGFVFSCFALVFCLLAEDLSPGARDQREIRNVQRRARERQQGERQRLADLEHRVLGRLDAHDLALGLDTRDVRRPIARGRQGELTSAPSWFYEDRGNTAGPVSKAAILGLLATGNLRHESLVWTEGMSDWRPLGELL